MQMLPLRNFSFDLTSKKTSSEGERGRDRSNERRDRWRRIRIFSQGPLRVTPRPSPATTQNTRSSNSPSPAMSDFFSRESELLGEGQLPPATASTVGVEDIDLDLAASAFPDISLDGSGDIPTPVPVPISTEKVAGSFSFDSFPEPTRATTTEVKITGNDEIERFEDQFPDIGASSSDFSPVTQQPSFGAPPPFAPRPQPSTFASTPILQQPLPDEEEPEVIKVWRDKQAAEIKARDDASQARRQETIAKAERSIDVFYEEYNNKKEQNIIENKRQEAEYLSSFSDSLSAGTTWSRICDYIDLQNSQSKTLARTGAGTTDLSRFKEVLLRLKREGDAAPGAAGY